MKVTKVEEDLFGLEEAGLAAHYTVDLVFKNGATVSFETLIEPMQFARIWEKVRERSIVLFADGSVTKIKKSAVVFYKITLKK